MLRAIKALIKTIKNIFEASLWKTILKSLILTALGLVGFVWFVNWAFAKTSVFNINWLEWILDTIGGIGAGVAAWFLFPLLLPIIASLFQETIAKKIEEKHYKNNRVDVLRPFWGELFYDIKFICYAIFLNAICLPLYMIPMVNLVVYYGLNSYLVGREFFEIAASRHLGKKHAEKLFKNHRFSSVTGGLFIIFLANIPLLNLLSPFIGIVLMVHIFHSINRSSK